MGKQSAFAKAVQREVDIQLRLYGRNRMQLAEDAALPDNAFELAVVDPPYGDGMGSFKRAGKSRFGGRFDRYKGGKS